MISRFNRLPSRLKQLLRLLALLVVLASIVDASHNHALFIDQPDDCVLCHQADHLSSAATLTGFHWPQVTQPFLCFAPLVLLLGAASFPHFHSRAPPQH